MLFISLHISEEKQQKCWLEDEEGVVLNKGW